MGKITSITVVLGRAYKHPYQAYETWRIEGSCTATVEEGEIVSDVRDAVAKDLRELMVSAYKDFKPKEPKKNG